MHHHLHSSPRDARSAVMLARFARCARIEPRMAPSRRRVATKASKSSKMGRFPSTKSVEHTPAFAAAPDIHGELDIDAVVARWGASATIVDDICATFGVGGGGAARENARELGAPRVLLTHKNENVYNAYACEIAAMTRASRSLCVGMFLAMGDARAVRHAAGLRAEIVPLFARDTAEALLADVETLRVTFASHVNAPETAFFHDCVARHPHRMGSDALGAAFGRVVDSWGAGLSRARGDERQTEDVARFAVIESAQGYVFGLVSYAPSSLSLRAVDWARKPQHFSAGTRAEIALACVNVAAAGCEAAFDVDSGSAALIDPCCGSGTMLHAAWTRGFAVAGGDISPGAVAMTKTNVGYFVARAGRSATMPRAVERDALEPNAFQDAYGSHKRVGAIVSNLPFGRRVAIGGGDGDGRASVGAFASEYAPMLTAFRDAADRHVFISGVPIADDMRAMGYKNVSDVSLCRFGRSFMTIALGESASGALEPATLFGVDEALERAAGKKEKKWQKSKSKVDIDARFANPNALRIAIDVSYEQDSTRARRSVAKQLCECVGVSHRNDNLALTYCAWRGPIAEESREYFFSDRWDCIKKDDRDVEEVFAPEDIVYMSPDADEALDEVDASKVYVVGGIVDLATRGMRTSVTRATTAGLRAVRLPIREFKPEQTHTVLNIDAVVKILAARRSGLSWDETFERELPKRQKKERPKREKRERVVE